MMSVGGMNASMLNMGRADAQVLTRREPQYKETLPLAPDYFKKPRLSASTVHEFERAAQSIVDAALDRSRKERIYGGADESWRDIGAAHGYKRYTKTEGNAQNYRIQGVIRAPMVNVMGLLYVERNAELVERRSAFYGNALDAQTLYVLRERAPTDMHQHMTLRWEAFQLATATDIFMFDTALLEYVGVALDADRQPVGFKVAHSVELPQVKQLLKTHGLHRLDMNETMVLRPTNNNAYTEFTLEGSFVTQDRLPAAALSAFLTAIAQRLGRIPMEIQSRRLASMKVIDKDMWVPTNERKNCSVCLSRFGMMGKKHHCRSCGEVICKSCVVARPNRDEIKFCKKCVVIACAEDELVIPERQPVATPSSSSTSSRQTRESRDSYASSLNRLSEERLSASVFMPQGYNHPHQHQQQPIKPTPTVASSTRSQPQPQHYNHHHHSDYRYVDDLKHHAREDNLSVTSNSMTASETSYSGSSFSNIESTTPEFNDYYRPEGSMIYLDTRQMMRGTPSSDEFQYNASGRGCGAGNRTPASMQDVESSLAQQRHLLQEMMHQANRSYRPNAPVKVKY